MKPRECWSKREKMERQWEVSEVVGGEKGEMGSKGRGKAEGESDCSEVTVEASMALSKVGAWRSQVEEVGKTVHVLYTGGGDTSSCSPRSLVLCSNWV